MITLKNDKITRDVHEENYWFSCTSNNCSGGSINHFVRERLFI